MRGAFRSGRCFHTRKCALWRWKPRLPSAGTPRRLVALPRRTKQQSASSQPCPWRDPPETEPSGIVIRGRTMSYTPYSPSHPNRHNPFAAGKIESCSILSPGAGTHSPALSDRNGPIGRSSAILTGKADRFVLVAFHSANLVSLPCCLCKFNQMGKNSVRFPGKPHNPYQL